MTEAEFGKELKSLHGGYVLYGEEDYLKYSYSKEARKHILDDTFAEWKKMMIPRLSNRL
jgi:DNA polymerase III delta subunit